MTLADLLAQLKLLPKNPDTAPPSPDGQPWASQDMPGSAPVPAFPSVYQAAKKYWGYPRNPYEVSARQTAESVVNKKYAADQPFRMFDIAEKTWDGDVAAMDTRLRRIFPEKSDAEIASAIKYARQQASNQGGDRVSR